MDDLKIINGKIYDTKTNQEKLCDIAISAGKITEIGHLQKPAKQVIDAQGMVVSPGFIDIHMHEEVLGNTIDGDDYDIANYMLKMGVTTGIGGNCGSLRQSYDVFSGFVDTHGAPINYALFAGHTFLREQAGNEDRYAKTTGHAMDKLKRLCFEMLRAGAIGISFGFEYSPGTDTEEAVDLIQSVAEKPILLSAHYRKDAKQGIASIRELCEISRTVSCPMQISHIGSCTAFGQMDESLLLIQQAIDAGVDVMADCYPYAAFSTAIGSAAYDDGCFDNWNKSYNNVMLTEEPYRNTYCDKELFEYVREHYPQMSAIGFVMNEEEVIEALKSPFVMVGSDGGFRRSQGHPRGAGAFPRVLGRYVRDQGNLSLQEALYKMTAMPADRLGLRTKGRIAEGMDADIVIFDPSAIIDRASFEEPTRLAEGIHYVIVNGEIAVKDNVVVQNRLGRMIRQKELHQN